MKIGITCYPTVGGSGVVATELGKALAAKGHDIHFITSSMPYRLNGGESNIYFHEVTVSSYAVFQYPPYDLALASRMADVIKREELDVLHVHYAVPHAVSAYLAKEMAGSDVKIVTTLHGTDITVLGYDPSLSDIIRFGIEKSDAVTAVSHDLIRQTRELLDVERPVETVYNFVDPDIYYPREDKEIRESIGLDESTFIMSHVSNFRKVKRVEDVVHTFARVRHEQKAALLLIGEGPEMPVIRRLTEELGVEDDVIFAGSQKRVAELLAASDVNLLLSSKESFGLVLLEAMACGVPVIGSDAGGIPEVIEEGISGFIRPLGDIDAFTEAALQLAEDQPLQRRMGLAAAERVQTTFNRDLIVQQYERVYLQACGR
ncbi:N-acetyl-alpha-D-glucosaminyl L-malate synthase BshA [Alkalicoccus chagannorensis]|uniref:N-acetyl-alpha-D-glucosaminyl L-malate synthase BshA n=1 Tax=Alkalicoccus chagannorensis TaxID=427072 RepID=UPI000409D034|nr:N-acetyl-alpha-D-glucosaminyl L-malate synthase BshA [Alkalicoccus chagannorensis]